LLGLKLREVNESINNHCRVNKETFEKTVIKPRDTIFNIDQVVSKDVENRKSSRSVLTQFQTVVTQVNIWDREWECMCACVYVCVHVFSVVIVLDVWGEDIVRTETCVSSSHSVQWEQREHVLQPIHQYNTLYT
jgi:hypothetical protein